MNVPVRLRQLVEVVLHDDGTLYLLRGPAGGDCVIRDASPDAIGLIDLLAAGGGLPAALAERMRERGIEVTEDQVCTMLEELSAVELVEPVADDDWNDRLSRQLLYLRDRRPPGADASELQRQLRDAAIVIIGCGGLGSWAAVGLACIGIGQLTLIDDDVVEHSNLNRQILFKEADIGRAKVDAAAEALRAFNGALDVVPLQRRISDAADARAAVRGRSFAVACADHPPYVIARWINAACAHEGVPHISAGQLPPIVRVGPTVIPGETACVQCLEHDLRARNPLHDRLEAMRRVDSRPQATLGPASGIVGQLIAMEVMHHLTGIAEPATANHVWWMDLRTLVPELVRVPRARDCPACASATHTTRMGPVDSRADL